MESYRPTLEQSRHKAIVHYLHMLVWLKDAPTANIMQAALKDEHFQVRMAKYIESTICADIDNKNTEAIN